MSTPGKGAYGADDDLVDYILGITYEIWEDGNVGLIERYYGENAPVWGLDAVVVGSAAVIANTRAVLKAFPDRLLLGDDVIWSDDGRDGRYSSHRVVSPMTNLGASAFGPATGKRVWMMNIADCVVEDGVITKEWLMRDSHALVSQLGFEPLAAAEHMAQRRDDTSRHWLSGELARLQAHGIARADDFPTQIVAANFTGEDRAAFGRSYAPYAVLHRSPMELHSGRAAIDRHYGALRTAFDVDGLAVEHVARQAYGSSGEHVAARWALSATHVGDFLGLPASGKPVFVLGASHYRVVDGRIVVEWTVFDGLALLSQLV